MLQFLQGASVPRDRLRTNIRKPQPTIIMKYLIALVAAVLTFTVSGCAHKHAQSCTDGSCCAKK
jgi:hypothetical protein